MAKQTSLRILGNHSFGEKRYVVLLDNASIHHSDRIVKLIKSTGAIMLYSSPYIPDINPIECMFGIYKASLLRFSRNGHNWIVSHIFFFIRGHTEYIKEFLGIVVCLDVKRLMRMMILLLRQQY